MKKTILATVIGMALLTSVAQATTLELTVTKKEAVTGELTEVSKNTLQVLPGQLVPLVVGRNETYVSSVRLDEIALKEGVSKPVVEYGQVFIGNRVLVSQGSGLEENLFNIQIEETELVNQDSVQLPTQKMGVPPLDLLQTKNARMSGVIVLKEGEEVLLQGSKVAKERADNRSEQSGYSVKVKRLKEQGMSGRDQTVSSLP